MRKGTGIEMAADSDCVDGTCEHEHWQSSNDGDYVDRRRTNFHNIATKYYLRPDGTYRIAVITPHGQTTIEVDDTGVRAESIAAEGAPVDALKPEDTSPKGSEDTGRRIVSLGSSDNPFVTISGGGK